MADNLNFDATRRFCGVVCRAAFYFEDADFPFFTPGIRTKRTIGNKEYQLIQDQSLNCTDICILRTLVGAIFWWSRMKASISAIWYQPR